MLGGASSSSGSGGSAGAGETQHASHAARQQRHDGAGSSGSSGGAASDEAERRRLWMLAIKPPMYSVGIVPVLVRPSGGGGCVIGFFGAPEGGSRKETRRGGGRVRLPHRHPAALPHSAAMPTIFRHPTPPCFPQVGAAAAYGEGGALAWGRCLQLVGGAVCVIAWLNLR